MGEFNQLPLFKKQKIVKISKTILKKEGIRVMFILFEDYENVYLFDKDV